MQTHVAQVPMMWNLVENPLQHLEVFEHRRQEGGALKMSWFCPSVKFSVCRRRLQPAVRRQVLGGFGRPSYFPRQSFLL